MENNFEAAEKYPEEVFKVFVQELQRLPNEIEEFMGGNKKNPGKFENFPHNLSQKMMFFQSFMKQSTVSKMDS